MAEKQYPSRELIQKTVTRFRAMGDEVRLKILLYMRGRECNVRTLVEELGLAQATVSKHLSILRNAGIVDFRRDGAQSIYKIKDDSVFEICSVVCTAIKREQMSLSAALDGDDFNI